MHHVADGRGQETLAGYYETWTPEELAQMEMVAMYMWGPYIAATLAALPEGNDKIAFDKFHVAMHLGAAVDRVRREESRTLRERGDETLKARSISGSITPSACPQNGPRDSTLSSARPSRPRAPGCSRNSP